jgi:channel protein (hemolysin III family)
MHSRTLPEPSRRSRPRSDGSLLINQRNRLARSLNSYFGATLVILYLSSMFTHWLPMGRTKEFFFTLDQIAIFMLIAGTYTPIALISLHGPFGWVIFGIEWGLAIIGITIKLLRPVSILKRSWLV